MTAEVVILNKSAIALAADSAVTIGGDGGKIYNTVNKLFALNKAYPVGIMVYANADYMGVPFETIIKLYRKTEKDARPTIQAYAETLIAFLDNEGYTSKTQQEQNIARTWHTVFDDILDDIRTTVRQEIRIKGECTSTRQKQIVDEILAVRLGRLERAKVADGFEKVRPSRVVTQNLGFYEGVRDSVFGAGLGKSQNMNLKKIAGLVAVKEHPYSTYSGVVIAGFGEDEVFPQYCEFRLHGVINSISKVERVASKGIQHGGSMSMIQAFAQREMVIRFMEGVDNRYENYINGAMRRALRSVATGVINVVKVPDEEKGKISEGVEKLIQSQLEGFRKDSREYRKEKFVDPVLDVVVSLPKEELAQLAEALVNLTSIKRRVSAERETVGGPIDVAVISKGDGFIWIKRKHYFRPELNLHFTANHLASMSKEGSQ